MSEGDGTPDRNGTKRVFIRSYGCQMNVYDSERMTELLKPHGYRTVDAPDGADLVILNTCHIREKAAEKVFSDLGRLRPLKQAMSAAGREMTVAVAGCVAQAEGSEIRRRMPFVDLVVGPQTYHRLPEMLARRVRAEGDAVDTEFAAIEKFDALTAPRQAPGTSAFVTIQEGCDKFCSFCVVPYTRGAEVSRPAAAIGREVADLAAGGVREVTLLGQNVNAWRSAPPADARDIRANDDGSWGLGQLCRYLARIGELGRLRFMTSHPRDMDRDLIDAFGSVEKLMPFLHLPVQSGSDAVLAAMNRGHTADDYLRLVERLRAARPDLALSSDFIVGFPGETTGDFERTLALIERVGYASAYCFAYSQRPGTPAAALPKQIARAEKEARLERVLALTEKQKSAFNRSFVGRRLAVLLDRQGRHDGQLIGRSPYLQSVHAQAPQSMLGQMADLAIVSASANALAGALAGDQGI